MSEKTEAPLLPGEVWRDEVWRDDFRMNETVVVCIVDGSIIVLQPVYFVVNEWQAARVAREFEAIRAWALSLRVSLAAALRTADRLRHGQTIEGDGICPNEMRAERALVALRRAAEAQRFVMDPTELPAGPAVSEIRLRATVVGGHIDEARRALAGGKP